MFCIDAAGPEPGHRALFKQMHALPFHRPGQPTDEASRLYGSAMRHEQSAQGAVDLNLRRQFAGLQVMAVRLREAEFAQFAHMRFEP